MQVRPRGTNRIKIDVAVRLPLPANKARILVAMLQIYLTICASPVFCNNLQNPLRRTEYRILH